MNDTKLIVNLKNAIETTKTNIVYNVNTELLKLYMYIGEQIQKDIEELIGKSDYKNTPYHQFPPNLQMNLARDIQGEI